MPVKLGLSKDPAECRPRFVMDLMHFGLAETTIFRVSSIDHYLSDFEFKLLKFNIWVDFVHRKKTFGLKYDVSRTRI